MKKPVVALIVGMALGGAPGAARAGEADSKELHTLNQAMPELALSTTILANALWVDDFETVAREARAIAKHAVVSKEERGRIAAALRKETEWFLHADAQVHKSALLIAEAAEKKDAVKAAAALGKMQEGCAACHQAYRARLRTK